MNNIPNFEKQILALSWDESKHPRGQPENAGEFASGKGGGKGKKKVVFHSKLRKGASQKERDAETIKLITRLHTPSKVRAIAQRVSRLLGF